MSDDEELYENRMSDVDGYTVVRREGERTMVHLLRPYPDCDVEGGSLVEGSRELVLMTMLGEDMLVGSCRTCFPLPVDDG